MALALVIAAGVVAYFISRPLSCEEWWAEVDELFLHRKANPFVEYSDPEDAPNLPESAYQEWLRDAKELNKTRPDNCGRETAPFPGESR